ncbi:MAG: Zn2+/Cd2+-exporting ATPase [Clostridiales bacterium]|nr:Zn2+/Cd2+-exporting ATPase [Clostridiales bacterium]
MEVIYYLNHLGCANCAAKMEEKLKKQPQIANAIIDFVNKKLIITTMDVMSEEHLLSLITPIITAIEGEVTLTAWDTYKKNTAGITSHSHTSHCEDGCCTPEHSHEHSHSHAHSHEHTSSGFAAGFSFMETIRELAPLFVGILVGYSSIFLLPEGGLRLLGILLGYLILSYEVLLTAAKNILHGEVFDENFLMAIATIGAFIIGEYPEALAVMVLYQIGEFFQDMAVDKSRKHLSDAMNLKADYANRKVGDQIETVEPKDVLVGDILLIKPSEKIPLDGIVIEGSSFVDTSSLTGESVPREVKVNDSILSGCINGSKSLYIQVTKEYKDSTVAKILDLVENASARKSPTENFITKFARIYTPIVVIAALLLAILPPVITGTYDFIPWIYKACGFLVVSCPCALVISVPLGFFGGIGCASRNGIIVKGSNYLEALCNVSYAVFDKTGTLTKGNFRVSEVVPRNGFSRDEILETASAIESLSTHPIAKSIVASYPSANLASKVSNYEEIAGHGVKANYQGHLVLLGNETLLTSNDILVPATKTANGTIIHLSINAQYAGYIKIEDEIKEDSKKAIHDLKAKGIQTIMLTGDNAATAEYVAKTLAVDSYYAQLLPADKVDQIETLLSKAKEKEKILFVGDGINDAPVLARADVGVAMGGVGSDAAIEAADIVLMTDEPSQLKRAIDIAHYTRKIVSENIAFSLGVKLLVMVLLAFGLSNMWLAIFADVGVAMIAIVNSIRTLHA